MTVTCHKIKLEKKSPFEWKTTLSLKTVFCRYTAYAPVRFIPFLCLSNLTLVLGWCLHQDTGMSFSLVRELGIVHSTFYFSQAVFFQPFPIRRGGGALY